MRNLGAIRVSNSSQESQRDERPAFSPEDQEARCISLAYNLVEERLKNGTATSQETCLFLKMGSLQAKEENRKLQEEIKLLQAKTENLEAFKVSAKIAEDALRAMKVYSGNADEDDQDIFGTNDH